MMVARNPIRVALFARKPVGERALQLISDELGRESIALVVSNSEPEGWWNDAEVIQLARRMIFPTLPSTSKREEVARAIATEGANCIISVQHDKIISADLLALATNGAYNVHLAPLPEYQGWHSASHALLDESPTFGATCHVMTENVDFGPVVSRIEFDIEPGWTISELYAASEDAGIETLRSLIGQLQNGHVETARMEASAARYFSKNELGSRLDQMRAQGVPEGNLSRAVDFSVRIEREENRKK